MPAAARDHSQVLPRAEVTEARDAGIARGLNLSPGEDDDGWIVPPPVELSDGTVVRLMKDGEALHAWYEMIEAARHSVFIELYIFAGDATGRAFMELLARKAREGVRVYVLYDSFGSWQTPRKLFDELRGYGVNVQEFHPVWPWHCNFSWRPFNRDHRKLLVVDGAKAGLGGLNIADEYGGSWVSHEPVNTPELWRDCGMAIEGPGARPLAESFIRMWLYVTRGGPAARSLLSYNLEMDLGPIGVLASVPSMDSQMSCLLGKLMRQAKRSLELTMAYFAPSEYLVTELCSAAKRGVRVRLMLPSQTDVRIMVTAARSFYARLMDSGVQVFERQQVRLHAKTLVIDEAISLVGSTNFDHRSVDYNCELATIVRSEAFGRQMVALFEHDVRYAACIEPGAWRRRPMRDRWIQWLVNRSRYLL